MDFHQLSNSKDIFSLTEVSAQIDPVRPTPPRINKTFFIILLIHILSMFYPINSNHFFFVINLIYDSIIAYSYSPIILLSFNLMHSFRSWLLLQCQYTKNNSIKTIFGKILLEMLNILLCSSFNLQFIHYQSLSKIPQKV